MADRTACSVCSRPLDGIGMRIVVVQGVRYHGWCYLTVCAPSARDVPRSGQ